MRGGTRVGIPLSVILAAVGARAGDPVVRLVAFVRGVVAVREGVDIDQ